MGMRIVFGLMASHEPPAAVAQLVDALAPLRVVLHLCCLTRDFITSCINLAEKGSKSCLR